MWKKTGETRQTTQTEEVSVFSCDVCEHEITEPDSYIELEITNREGQRWDDGGLSQSWDICSLECLAKWAVGDLSKHSERPYFKVLANRTEIEKDHERRAKRATERGSR